MLGVYVRSYVNTKPMVYLVHQNYSGYLTKKHQDKHDNGTKKAIHSKFTKDGHRVVAAKLEILNKSVKQVYYVCLSYMIIGPPTARDISIRVKPINTLH